MTPASLKNFVFNTVASQTAGIAFSITITAKDAYGNTVTSYSSSPALSYSAGAITPTSATGGFSNGIWTGKVTVTTANPSATLTVIDGSATGTSNAFSVTHTAATTVAITPNSAAINARSDQA